MKNIPSFLIFTLAAIVFSSCHPTASVPKPDHVIVVIEENHGYEELIGSANAPYINQLARDGALFTNSHGVTHPSQPNYLALFSGSTQAVAGDDCLDNVTPYTTSNLGALLFKNNLTFKGYAATLPEVGSLVCTSLKSNLTGTDLYARKHAPWVNWLGDQENDLPASISLPMTSFPKDFNQLPTVAFAIPDMDYDMHNIGTPGDAAAIQRGDMWLKEHLGGYVEWAKTHNSLLIITFDEDDFKSINHIPTIFVGGPVKPGKYTEKISHYNVLHTIEAMFGLSPGDTTTAKPISDVWTTK